MHSTRVIARLSALAFGVGAGLAVLTASPATATGPCEGPANVIIGTSGSDVINGTAGRDYIDGRGGNDKINGRGGNDTIVGGTGNDLLVGAGGDDCVQGGSGSDQVYGDENSHDPATDTGEDSLNGGGGNNDWAYVYEWDETSSTEKAKH